MIDPNQGAQPTAMLLTNGKVLIAGGGPGDLGGSTSAEIYDPATGAFSATGKMTAGIDVWPAAALLPDGKVLIAGESNGFTGGAAELYDPVAGTFSAPGGSQSAEGHAATLLPDGTVLLSGGWVCCGYTIASAQIYHPGVLVPAPQLFSLTGDGKGQGAIWHAVTGEIASPSNPAVAGEVLSMYTTSLADGGVIPPQVSVGGRLAEVLYFGAAPGYPGYYQVNIRVPSGVAPGPAVPVRLTYIGRPSNAVTIGSLLSALLPPISVTTVRNAASNLSGPVAPGEIVVIGGFGLGPAQLISSVSGSDGLYGTQLAGTTVQINGAPAILIYTGATQVAAIVPDSVTSGTAEITVTYQGQTSASFPVPVAPAAPGIFTVDSTGQGHAASINQNGLINTPAHWGDVITLFVTGTGKTASAVTIHGYNLSVVPIFFGKGPVPGVMQIQVPIPMGQDCDTPVVVQVGDTMSQPGVTIAIDICI